MEEALRLGTQIAALLQQVSILLPQLSENYSTIKGALGSHDDAAVAAMIEDLHARTNNATAELLALRDPEPEADA